MKRKRTTRRTIKTPTADKKPMASGGTDKRTQKEKNHHNYSKPTFSSVNCLKFMFIN